MDKPDRKQMPDKGKASSKQSSAIKFNLEKHHLQCFMSSRRSLDKTKPKTHRPEAAKTMHLPSDPQFLKNRPHFDPSLALFNNKLLLMQYGQDEVYTDSTKVKNVNDPQPESPKQESSEGEDELVASCVRVITQQTDNTSNPISARYSLQKPDPSDPNMYLERPYEYPIYQNYQMYLTPRTRNRRTVSSEESSNFQIDLDMIQKDGRTTLMLRHIPNKYTRDMVLQEIDSLNFRKKYDFFYLPIDYRNECNVGYAFINFIHTKFIPEFYEKFHRKGWQKFNSEKICQVCYARIQGTAQLVSHFKDSNVIQQKDKKFRPMIDVSYSSLAEMVERQKTSMPDRRNDE